MGPRQEGTGLRLCNRPVAADCGEAEAGDCGERLAAEGTGFLVPAEPGAAGAVRPGLRGGRGRFRPRIGQEGRHKSRFVTAASALGPAVWRAWSGPGGPCDIPRPLCLVGREWLAGGAGTWPRGGASAPRVTAEPDTGRARRHWGRHETRAGVG